MDNQKNVKTSFWDFKTPKVYTTRGEKALDFWVSLLIFSSILNFFLTKAFSFIYKHLGDLLPPEYSISEFLPFLIPCLIVIILMILGVVYFWSRRRYIAYGLSVLIVQGILMLTILLKSVL